MKHDPIALPELSPIASLRRAMQSRREWALLPVVAGAALAGVAGWVSLTTIEKGATGRAGSKAVAVSPMHSTVKQAPAVEPVRYVALPADQARAVNATVPFTSEPLVAARPFLFAGKGEDRERAADCLATAQFYEAGPDRTGQMAVAQVVLNRLRHPAFPKSVCAVVFQGSERATGCQFSFTCDGALDRRKPTPDMWRQARDLADAMLSGGVDASVGLATHYHTDWVVPVWSASLDKLSRVGTHLFFRWQGWWGTRPAFAARRFEPEAVVPKMVGISAAHRAVLPLDEDIMSVEAVGDEPGAKTTTSVALPQLAKLVEPEDGRPDLRGNRVVRASSDGRMFLLAMNGQAFPGTYAMTALSLCRDKPDCQVIGWLDPKAIPTDGGAMAAKKRTAIFIYERDKAKSIERASWDCRLIQQIDPAKCI